MTFGLTCAPSVFQRLMDVVLCGLSYNTCMVYLDDIILFGRKFEEQIDRVTEVFERIRVVNLKLKPSKCSICVRQVEFLGHIVSEGQLAMLPDKISRISTWPPPQNIRELRAFMGLSRYYCRFIRGFSLIATPLYRLMGKDAAYQ